MVITAKSRLIIVELTDGNNNGITCPKNLAIHGGIASNFADGDVTFCDRHCLVVDTPETGTIIGQIAHINIIAADGRSGLGTNDRA